CFPARGRLWGVGSVLAAQRSKDGPLSGETRRVNGPRYLPEPGSFTVNHSLGPAAADTFPSLSVAVPGSREMRRAPVPVRFEIVTIQPWGSPVAAPATVPLAPLWFCRVTSAAVSVTAWRFGSS